MTDADRELLERADSIAERAYAPYSKFFVGAAMAHTNTTLRLGYTRDTELAAGRPPGGLDADEVYAFDVRSSYISGSNLKVAIGLAAEVYRDV